MDKYIGFDVDSKKTVACVVQKGKSLTNQQWPLNPCANFDLFVRCYN